MSECGWVVELVSEWVRVFLCVCVCAPIHMCVYIYIYIYIYVCVYICIIDRHVNTRMYIHSIYVYLDG